MPHTCRAARRSSFSLRCHCRSNGSSWLSSARRLRAATLPLVLCVYCGRLLAKKCHLHVNRSRWPWTRIGQHNNIYLTAWHLTRVSSPVRCNSRTDTVLCQQSTCHPNLRAHMSSWMSSTGRLHAATLPHACRAVRPSSSCVRRRCRPGSSSGSTAAGRFARHMPPAGQQAALADGRNNGR